VAELVDALP